MKPTQLNKKKLQNKQKLDNNDNFISENRNRVEANCKFFFFCSGIINLLFDGLAYITSGHFAHCSQYYAIGKIPVRIIC